MSKPMDLGKIEALIDDEGCIPLDHARPVVAELRALRAKVDVFARESSVQAQRLRNANAIIDAVRAVVANVDESKSATIMVSAVKRALVAAECDGTDWCDAAQHRDSCWSKNDSIAR